MDILFVHQNFPAQFQHLAKHFASNPDWRVFAIGSSKSKAMPGVKLERYSIPNTEQSMVHPFARRFNLECRRAEQVLYVLASLKSTGMNPRIIVVHPGWGEALPLRELFPKARIVAYCEFYYRSSGADLGFDPEFPQLGLDGFVRVNARNASMLMALTDANAGLCPTFWQRSLFPPEVRPKIHIMHDGIDTEKIAPDPAASVDLPKHGLKLQAGDEIVTFVARNLEPYRGYHIFMRALPAILKARPKARILILGRDGVSYGSSAPKGKTWKDIFWNEVAGEVDASRVHFLGHVPYPLYNRILQLTRAYIYLTYPFVLSWSMLEAMAAGCLVIGSDTEPVREVIEEGRNGLLVPFFSPDALARRTIDALKAPERFAHMRQEARRTIVETYDLRTICLPKHIQLLLG